MACQIKSVVNAGKQDVPNVLWIGVRDGDPGPIMVAREKPEAFKLKVWRLYPGNISELPPNYVFSCNFKQLIVN